jgi:signal peptidase I
MLSDNERKSVFGFRFYNVLTASMAPRADGSSPAGGFDEGDLIIVRLVAPETIAVGDIITFNPGRDPGAYLTHRVVAIKDEVGGEPGLYFVTRGDANNADDPPITADRLIGKKVLALPKVGQLVDYVKAHPLVAIVLVGSSAGFVLLLAAYFRATTKDSGGAAAGGPEAVVEGPRRVLVEGK